MTDQKKPTIEQMIEWIDVQLSNAYIGSDFAERSSVLTAIRAALMEKQAAKIINPICPYHHVEYIFETGCPKCEFKRGESAALEKQAVQLPDGWEIKSVLVRVKNGGEVMANITVILKDGTKREFKHEGRPGGSYSKTVKYENGFAIIEDEWGKKTAFPSENISEVIAEPVYRGW